MSMKGYLIAFFICHTTIQDGGLEKGTSAQRWRYVKIKISSVSSVVFNQRYGKNWIPEAPQQVPFKGSLHHACSATRMMGEWPGSSTSIGLKAFVPGGKRVFFFLKCARVRQLAFPPRVS